MPPPPGLINLSVSELIAAAGGDPWKINDDLQAGDAGAINTQADAFHAASGCVAEVEDDFVSAKQRFEQGWRHNGVEHPITDSAAVTRATAGLNLQKPQVTVTALHDSPVDRAHVWLTVRTGAVTGSVSATHHIGVPAIAARVHRR